MSAALLRAGADKVSLNTAALERPALIREAAERFGSQCIVVAIDARRDTRRDKSSGSAEPSGEIVRRNGSMGGVHARRAAARTGRDAVEWAREATRLGAGEILLTSMDRDGTKDGYDLELTRAISEAVDVPVIASGGAGSLEHLWEGLVEGGADAVLAASIFHFGIHTIAEAKAYLRERGVDGPDRAVSLDDLRFDERGLIPAVVQEADTGEVLMVAWMDRRALDATLETGLSHFWSRSRGQLWRKGETSGHTQHVDGLYADCDGDTLLVQVHQDGVACHTGHRTCFFTALPGGEGATPPPTCSNVWSGRSRPARRRRRPGRTSPACSPAAKRLCAGRSARRPPR